MKTMMIRLETIDNVKDFVNTISKFDSEFELESGKYIIDAKSIMGIFSLDLSKDIKLHVHTESTDIMNAVSKFAAAL